MYNTWLPFFLSLGNAHKPSAHKNALHYTT